MKIRSLSYGLRFSALFILALVISGCGVNIISPNNNSHHVAGNPILFSAKMPWYIQGDIDELEWRSSIDGLLGTGRQITLPDLSVGRPPLSVGYHRIEAEIPNAFPWFLARDSIRLSVTCKLPVEIGENGIPQFVCANYIDLDRIYRISKFRSGIGHDSSDDFESCRSMKHYFQPMGDGTNWHTVRIFSPVHGTVFRTIDEWAGTKVEITPDGFPDFRIAIFHVNLSQPLTVGQQLTAGKMLGRHFSGDTYSDIEVVVDTPDGMKKISYFEVMTDDVFQHYQARGLSTRNDAIISRGYRDHYPLRCSNGDFTYQGFGNWVNLN